MSVNSIITQLHNCYGRWVSASLSEKFLLVGFVLVLVYAFALLPSLKVFRFAEFLVAIFFVAAVFSPYGRKIRQDPLFWLMLAFLAYLILTVLWLNFSLPEGIKTSGQTARYYFKAFFLLVISFWLGARKNGGWILLAAFMAGVLFHLATATTTSEWIAGWQGTRVDFDFLNAQHTGVFFGTMLLCLLIFSPRLFVAVPLILRPLLTLLLISLAALTLFGVLVTQVRAVWLGLGVALSFLIILSCFLLLIDRKLRSGWSGYVLGFLVVVSVILSAGAGIFGMDRIMPRFASEQAEITHVLEHRSSEKIRLNGVGIRVVSWELALDWIGERPWFGWGPGTTSHLIELSPELSEQFKRNFGHIHNSYLEAALSLGLIGISLLGGLVVWVGLATVLAFRRGLMPIDAFVFAWVFFVFWIVVNFFESYIIFRTGFYLNAIIGGFVYSFYLNGTDIPARSQSGRR